MISRKTMRVLYIQPAEGFGGAERQALVTLSRLSALGIEVLPVIGPGEKLCRALDRAGVASYPCPEMPSELDHPHGAAGWIGHAATQIWRYRRAYVRILELARSRGVDLIYASRPAGWALAAALGGRLGRPTVWRAGSRVANWRHRVGLWLLAGSAPELLICNSTAVRDSIAPALGCPAVILGNAVDLWRFSPGAASPRFRAQLGLGDRPTVGVVARPSPGKGFELLADVVRRLLHRRPDARVIVAGEYGWRAHYEQRWARLGLDGAVTFLGHVDDMAALYESCDVVLLTSLARSTEGLPNALLEAMAMQRPVVSTDVGGVGDAVQHGVNGLLAPADDAPALAALVLRLLDDSGLRTRLGAAGRATIVQRFAAERIVARLAAILRGVAAGGLRERAPSEHMVDVEVKPHRVGVG